MRYGIYLSSVGENSTPILLAELVHEAKEEGRDGVFIRDQVGKPDATSDPRLA